MPSEPLHVAIIGGGLCGLSLAIALTRQSISHTIYEAKSSFTEIGAGINIGPNALQAFDLIDPSTRETIFALATRNAPGKEDVWFTCRLAAATDDFEDGHLLGEILAPPTGNMTLSRNELLQHLAKAINLENAKFNKRLSDIGQDKAGATLSFTDGTKDRASLVIGCDGAHSLVRRLMLGSDHPAAKAKYTQTGAYRAVIPMAQYEKTVGSDIAKNSHVWLGPEGYVIQYPINRGEDVNLGVWPRKEGEWNQDGWVLPKQKLQMLEDMQAWGGTLQSVMRSMNEDTSFWAGFHYSVKPESYFQGRVCLIGDGAHAMGPHQGAGASQGMEEGD